MPTKGTHNRDVFDKTLYRSAYGNSVEACGTEHLVVCTCGRLQAKTTKQSDIEGIWARHLRKEEADERGYDLDGKYFVCRYDRTITDSMDAHGKICSKPK